MARAGPHKEIKARLSIALVMLGASVASEEPKVADRAKFHATTAAAMNRRGDLLVDNRDVLDVLVTAKLDDKQTKYSALEQVTRDKLASYRRDFTFHEEALTVMACNIYGRQHPTMAKYLTEWTKRCKDKTRVQWARQAISIGTCQAASRLYSQVRHGRRDNTDSDSTMDEDDNNDRISDPEDVLDGAIEQLETSSRPTILTATVTSNTRTMTRATTTRDDGGTHATTTTTTMTQRVARSSLDQDIYR
jgi:hypothetical protein